MKKTVKTEEQLNLVFETIRTRFKAKKKLNIEWSVPGVFRNLDQNALYWVWIAFLAAETCGLNESGKPSKLDMQDIHNVLRRTFLPTIEKVILGEKTKTLTSTSTLERKAFAEYMSEVKAYAYHVQGVSLLSKNEAGYEEMCIAYKNCKL